jgi:pyruvate-formate lyase-activating enzyme
MPCMSFDKLNTIEPAPHPSAKLGILIDWLVTLKCNYDCSYCPTVGTIMWPTVGHDNSIPHPDYDKCLGMLKQLYAYTDVMMISKKDRLKDATMNMYGGEAVFHPQFVQLAEATTREFEQYKDRWRLTRRLTTNGTATEKNWKTIVSHMEGVTMSYHTQGPQKLKKVFLANLQHLVDINKEFDVVVLMYPHQDYWQECLEFARWCKENKLRSRPRLLDGPLGTYSETQIQELSEFFSSDELSSLKPGEKLTVSKMRACCGGRPLCTNREFKSSQALVPRGPEGYKGWTCAANQFFIFGNTPTGMYYTNRDCRVRLDGKLGPIANIHTMEQYTNKIRKQIQETNTVPVLTCAQNYCHCGTCAPKARTPEDLAKIMKVYNTIN